MKGAERLSLDLGLPKQAPEIRPIRSSDMRRVARWISDARAEGQFSSCGKLTERQLRNYLKAQISEANDYTILVVEYDNQACGFVDFLKCDSRVELLGIYIEPAMRRRKIASYLLRLLSARWEYAGVRVAETRVFASNKTSLKLFTLLGFLSVADEVEDGRTVHVLRKTIGPLKRLTQLNPGYSRLIGKNLVAHHLVIATMLAEAIGKLDGVLLVLGLGSLARGFADEWSDVDIAVLGTGIAMQTLWRGERWFGKSDVDLFVVDVRKEPPSAWDEARRQAFSESIVLSSADSNLLKAVRKIVRMRPDEIRKLAVDKLFSLAWAGFAPPAWREKTYRGYLWSLPQDLWISRGCIAAAHNALDQALGLFFELLFVTNGRLPPDPKWQRFLVDEQDWLPEHFLSRLETLESCKRTERSFGPRSETLLQLIGETAKHLERERLLPEDMYSYYLRHSTVY